MAETDTVVARLRDPWKHSEELCTEAATELARLQAENEALRRERDEARTLVTEANNSLFGSQGYFHSMNGGPFNKYHLSKAIEDLKGTARRASTSEAAREAAEAKAARLEEALAKALAEVEYTPGDHPVVPVKHARFVEAVRAALEA